MYNFVIYRISKTEIKSISTDATDIVTGNIKWQCVISKYAYRIKHGKSKFKTL